MHSGTEWADLPAAASTSAVSAGGRNEQWGSKRRDTSFLVGKVDLSAAAGGTKHGCCKLPRAISNQGPAEDVTLLPRNALKGFWNVSPQIVNGVFVPNRLLYSVRSIPLALTLWLICPFVNNGALLPLPVNNSGTKRCPPVRKPYDVFEKFPDGSTLWRTCVIGRFEAYRKMRELAEHSGNEFFVIDIPEDEFPPTTAAPKTIRPLVKSAAAG